MKDVGIEHDVLVYCDEALSGCKNKQMIDSIALDQTQYWKFEYLNKVAEMDYDLFVFIDSDHFFVRKPSLDFHQIIGQDQWHSFLESPINDASTRRQDWWGLSNPKMVTLWRAFGVNQKTLYNTNGGFWICRKNFAQQARETVTNFREFQRKAGFNFPEEVAIAVLSHMFSADYSARLHKNYMDIWASEWTGALKDIIPNGKPWKFVEYMTNTESVVDPAIVHAMRSKKALVELGKYEMNRNTQRKYS